jgi:4-hydroxyphenylpyruvate dioxygenase
MQENPIGLDGMEFIEYTGPDADFFRNLFDTLGFTKVGKHKTQDIELYRQGGTNFLLNFQNGGFAESFHKLHGPSVCSTGFRVMDANKALEESVKRGAKKYEGSEESKGASPYQAVYGIGDSLIYFIDETNQRDLFENQFEYTAQDTNPEGFKLGVIDHLTNNVPKGEMQKWCDFYENIFNFKERRFFDIKGEKTGLISKVMRSPCGKITIPINEPTEDKSQIQEYLDEYKGSGIQHIALLTGDITFAVAKLREKGIEFLDVPDTYYEMVPERVPNVEENMGTLAKLKILVDGDDDGYLLQIFTQNQIGPIFYEIIQRKNHSGFGEGNFQALFEAIERDQERRGVL